MTTYGIGEFQMRNGGKAVVVKDTGDFPYSLVGFINGDCYYWHHDGRYHKSHESSFDLVAPWVEPAPAVTSEDEIATLKADLAAARAEIERLKNELGDPRGEIDHAKSITSALDAEISTLRAENERLILEHAEWFAAAYGGDFDEVVSGITIEARNKALDEASEVAARYGDFVVAAEIKTLKEQG